MWYIALYNDTYVEIAAYLSYHQMTMMFVPGTPDTLRFWTCTYSNDRGHNYQLAFVFYPYRMAFYSWGMLHHLFRFPIVYEFLVGLQIRERERKISVRNELQLSLSLILKSNIVKINFKGLIKNLAAIAETEQKERERGEMHSTCNELHASIPINFMTQSDLIS